ncbi:F-box/LRR-repeat protein 7 [Frankliniella fusca]|uniref:F-box/LRR-repeat protein 7 n=1 Tax=Frankliniella fusca TaxID=407009 RepID=A0AAE1H5G7_9NEOP|nr:F-box/LRR-repeat protein 7 [Frankliniella fusca]
MGSRRVTRSQNLRVFEVQTASSSGRPPNNQIVRALLQPCSLEVGDMSVKIADDPAKSNCSTCTGCINDGNEEAGDGLPSSAVNLSLHCDGSVQLSRVMRCPSSARSRKNLYNPHSTNQCSSSSHPSRMTRNPSLNRIRDNLASTESSSICDGILAEPTQAARVISCPIPNNSTKKRCLQDDNIIHENERQFDFGGISESDVLKCRSGQSSYPLRALKTIPNFQEFHTDNQTSHTPPALKTISNIHESQVDNDDSNINRLPDEILCMIFSYLPQLELLRNCSKVCHRWLSVSSSSVLWQTLSFCGQDIPIEHVCGSIRFSPMLKSITIKDRCDVDVILHVLQQHCRRLETINLVRCRPTDGSHQTLRAKFLYPFLKKAQLRNINLKGTDYRSKKFFQILSTMPDLKKLNISCSRGVSPQLLSEVAMNSNLKVFKNKWHSNSIYNGPKSMTIQLPGKIDDWACAYNLLFESAGKSLTTLEFYAAGISDSALAGIAKCRHLKKLCIYNANCLASESMAAIGSLLELKELLLHNAKLTTADVAHAFQTGNLSGLQSLHFNDSITANSDDVSADSCVKVAAEKLKKLKHLSITKCRELTDQGVEAVLTHCSDLLTLDLNGGLGISGQSFLLIPTRTPQLKLLIVEEDCPPEKNILLKTLVDNHSITVDRVSSWKHRTTSYLL